MTAHCPRGPVVLPPRAGEIPAHHALDREHVEFPADHRPAVGAELEEMVGDDLACPSEPERREPGEHLPLVRDRRRQDDVEGRDPVAGDELEAPVAELEDLPYLPARDMNRLRGHALTSSVSATSGRRRAKTTSTYLVNAPRSKISPRSTRPAISVSARTRSRKSRPSSHARIASRCTAR